MPKLLAMWVPLLLAGCGAPGIPLPPSLQLPQSVSDLRASRKGDKVYLAWTVPAQTTDGQSIRQLGVTRICRSHGTTMTECGSPAGEALPLIAAPVPGGKSAKVTPPQKINAQFVDGIPIEPVVHYTDQFTYAVEVLNPQGRSAGLSNQAHVPSAPAIAPPEVFRADLTAQGVQISWQCPARFAVSPLGIEDRLRIYRRLEGSQADTKVAEDDLTNCELPHILDQTFEWEKIYFYRAAVVSVVKDAGKPDIEIEGDDTQTVRVFAHDVFPPGVPSGLQAVFSGAGQQPFIDLIWAPDTDTDLAGYNLYRHEEGSGPVKINPELVKTPAYRDSNVQSGKRYFYSVSAVDLRNNESAGSEEASEAVP